MAYSWYTFAQAKTALASRLGDSSKIHFLDAELGLYLQEALRTFNSIANYAYDRVTFTTQAGFAFYDLTLASNPDSITAGTGASATNPPALLAASLTDRNLTNLLQYHLIEPITTDWSLNTPAMTSMFSNDDLVRAIERRRNQFLLETGCHLTHSQISYSAPASGRVSLSDSIIDIRRAAFLLSSIYYPLYRVDEYAANTLFIGWNSSSSQSHSYSFYLTPKPSLQLLPIGVAGTLDLITVNAPTDLLTSTGVSLNIPDDFSWIVKFGALADLLSRDGQSYDPFRASYCQQRWQQGLQLASSYSTIQAAYIGSNSVIPQSIYDLDTLDWNWQNMTGTPTDLITIGRNLIALHPVPTGSTTITLDILRNAPLPSADGDKINIGKEQFDIILDYATHLAMFKHGGDEFQATYPLLDRFMNLAMANNSRLLAEAGNYSIMNSLTRKNELDVPRLLAQ